MALAEVPELCSLGGNGNLQGPSGGNGSCPCSWHRQCGTGALGSLFRGMAFIKACVAIKMWVVVPLPLAVLGSHQGCSHTNALQFHVLENRHCKLLPLRMLPTLENLGTV